MVKPNTVLPEGAELLLKKLKREFGGYRPLIYDARLKHLGVWWFRVYLGLGSRNDREDWIADLPGCSASVHDYYWNGHAGGPNYESIQAAMSDKMFRAIEAADKRKAELLLKIISPNKQLKISRSLIEKEQHTVNKIICQQQENQ